VCAPSPRARRRPFAPSTSRTCRSPTRFAFEGKPRGTHPFDLPSEVGNAIARIESSARFGRRRDPAGRARQAPARRPRLRGTADLAQPLLGATYYISRRLCPFRRDPKGRGGGADAVRQLIDEQVSVLVLADGGRPRP
jgi:hypothetical protein